MARMRLFRRKTGEVPGLDTTSTADISFMLLIFFLVTSSMDSQVGLRRKLSPVPNDPQQELVVNKDDVLTIELLADGTLLADGDRVNSEELAVCIETIVRQRGDKHLLSLTAEREATFEDYYHLQETIIRTYRQMGISPRLSEQTNNNE